MALRGEKAKTELTFAQDVGFDGVCMPYAPEESGEISWLAADRYREAMAEFRQNDTGAAGRGALTDKRKNDIRKHLLNRTFV